MAAAARQRQMRARIQRRMDARRGVTTEQNNESDSDSPAAANLFGDDDSDSNDEARRLSREMAEMQKVLESQRAQAATEQKSFFDQLMSQFPQQRQTQQPQAPIPRPGPPPVPPQSSRRAPPAQQQMMAQMKGELVSKAKEMKKINEKKADKRAKMGASILTDRRNHRKQAKRRAMYQVQNLSKEKLSELDQQIAAAKGDKEKISEIILYKALSYLQKEQVDEFVDLFGHYRGKYDMNQHILHMGKVTAFWKKVVYIYSANITPFRFMLHIANTESPPIVLKDNRHTALEYAMLHQKDDIIKAILASERGTRSTYSTRVMQFGESWDSIKSQMDLFMKYMESLVSDRDIETTFKSLAVTLKALIRDKRTFPQALFHLLYLHEKKVKEKEEQLDTSIAIEDSQDKSVWKELQGTLSSTLKVNSFYSKSIDREWFSSHILNNPVLLDRIGPNSDRIRMKDLLRIVKKEMRREQNRLEREMNDQMEANEELWAQIMEFRYANPSYQHEDRWRNDVVPNGVKARLSEEELFHINLQSSSFDFDAEKVFDFQSYASELCVRGHLVNRHFQAYCKAAFEPLCKDHGALLESGPVKTLKRIVEKAEFEYPYARFPTTSRVLDVVRCQLIFQDAQSMWHAMESFKTLIDNQNNVQRHKKKNFLASKNDSAKKKAYKQVTLKIMKVKNMYDCQNEMLKGLDFHRYTNRLRLPIPCNYLDVKFIVIINVGDDMSMVGEIQFQLKCMERVKERQHSFYRIERHKEFVTEADKSRRSFEQKMVIASANFDESVLSPLIVHYPLDFNESFLLNQDSNGDNVLLRMAKSKRISLDSLEWVLNRTPLEAWTSSNEFGNSLLHNVIWHATDKRLFDMFMRHFYRKFNDLSSRRIQWTDTNNHEITPWYLALAHRDFTKKDKFIMAHIPRSLADDYSYLFEKETWSHHNVIHLCMENKHPNAYHRLEYLFRRITDSGKNISRLQTFNRMLGAVETKNNRTPLMHAIAHHGINSAGFVALLIPVFRDGSSQRIQDKANHFQIWQTQLQAQIAQDEKAKMAGFSKSKKRRLRKKRRKARLKQMALEGESGIMTVSGKPFIEHDNHCVCGFCVRRAALMDERAALKAENAENQEETKNDERERVDRQNDTLSQSSGSSGRDSDDNKSSHGEDLYDFEMEEKRRRENEEMKEFLGNDRHFDSLLFSKSSVDHLKAKKGKYKSDEQENNQNNRGKNKKKRGKEQNNLSASTSNLDVEKWASLKLNVFWKMVTDKKENVMHLLLRYSALKDTHNEESPVHLIDELEILLAFIPKRVMRELLTAEDSESKTPLHYLKEKVKDDKVRQRVALFFAEYVPLPSIYKIIGKPKVDINKKRREKLKARPSGFATEESTVKEMGGVGGFGGGFRGARARDGQGRGRGAGRGRGRGRGRGGRRLGGGGGFLAAKMDDDEKKADFSALMDFARPQSASTALNFSMNTSLLRNQSAMIPQAQLSSTMAAAPPLPGMAATSLRSRSIRSNRSARFHSHAAPPPASALFGAPPVPPSRPKPVALRQSRLEEDRLPTRLRGPTREKLKEEEERAKIMPKKPMLLESKVEKQKRKKEALIEKMVKKQANVKISNRAQKKMKRMGYQMEQQQQIQMPASYMSRNAGVSKAAGYHGYMNRNANAGYGPPRHMHMRNAMPQMQAQKQAAPWAQGIYQQNNLAQNMYQQQPMQRLVRKKKKKKAKKGKKDKKEKKKSKKMASLIEESDASNLSSSSRSRSSIRMSKKRRAFSRRDRDRVRHRRRMSLSMDEDDDDDDDEFDEESEEEEWDIGVDDFEINRADQRELEKAHDYRGFADSKIVLEAAAESSSEESSVSISSSDSSSDDDSSEYVLEEIPNWWDKAVLRSKADAKRKIRSNTFEKSAMISDYNSPYWLKWGPRLASNAIAMQALQKPHVVVCTMGTIPSKRSIIGKLLFDLQAINNERCHRVFGNDFDIQSASSDSSRIIPLHANISDIFQGRSNCPEVIEMMSDDYSYDMIVDINQPSDSFKTQLPGYAMADAALLFVDTSEEVLENKLRFSGKGNRGDDVYSSLFIAHVHRMKVVVCMIVMSGESLEVFQTIGSNAHRRFEEINEMIREMSNEISSMLKLGGMDEKPPCLVFVPVTNGSLEMGDNIVKKSVNMDWWRHFNINNVFGETLNDAISLLHKFDNRVISHYTAKRDDPLFMTCLGIWTLEETPEDTYVDKSNPSVKKKRGRTIIESRITSGTLKKWNRICFQPSNFKATVIEIRKNGIIVDEARAGDRVILRLSRTLFFPKPLGKTVRKRRLRYMKLLRMDWIKMKPWRTIFNDDEKLVATEDDDATTVASSSRDVGSGLEMAEAAGVVLADEKKEAVFLPIVGDVIVLADSQKTSGGIGLLKRRSSRGTAVPEKKGMDLKVSNSIEADICMLNRQTARKNYSCMIHFNSGDRSTGKIDELYWKMDLDEKKIDLTIDPAELAAKKKRKKRKGPKLSREERKAIKREERRKRKEAEAAAAKAAEGPQRQMTRKMRRKARGNDYVSLAAGKDGMGRVKIEFQKEMALMPGMSFVGTVNGVVMVGRVHEVFEVEKDEEIADIV